MAEKELLLPRWEYLETDYFEARVMVDIFNKWAGFINNRDRVNIVRFMRDAASLLANEEEDLKKAKERGMNLLIMNYKLRAAEEILFGDKELFEKMGEGFEDLTEERDRLLAELSQDA